MQWARAGRARSAQERTTSGFGVSSRAAWSQGWFVNRLAGDRRISATGEDRAEDGGDPEEPELLEGPAADDEGWTGAARRVDGEVRDRDTDEVDDGEAEADGDGREALRRAAIGGAEDDHKE